MCKLIKNKIFLVSYADGRYVEAQDTLFEKCNFFGIDKCIKFSRSDIVNSEFYKKNQKILDHKRGSGYWIWKPYIILEVMKRMNPGEILLYADAGMYPINSLDSLLELTKYSDVVLFNCGHTQKNYTKRDCFIIMNSDKEEYYNSIQSGAFLQIYKKTKFSIKFLKEWLKFCSDPRVVTDMENTFGKPNLSGYREHRHDQSILTNLRVKYSLPLFPDPTQYGGFINRNLYDSRVSYGTIFYHHRLKKENIFFYLIKYILITIKRLLIKNPK